MSWVGGKLEQFGCTPIALEFALDSYPGPAWEVSPLRHRSGWLMVSVATMETPFSAWSAPLVACVNDDGEPISNWLASKLLEMRCTLPREAEDVPPVELEWVTDALYWDFLGTCDLKHLAMIGEQEGEAEARIERMEAQGQRVASEVDGYVAGLRRGMRRGEIAPEERKATDDRIALVLDKLAEAEVWLRKRVAGIREEVGAVEESIFDSLQRYGEVEHLYSVQWRVKSIRQRRVDQDQILGRWTYEQKLYAAPDHVERTFSPYQRLRWPGPSGTDSTRSALPERISREDGEAHKGPEMTRRTAALQKYSAEQVEARKRAKKAEIDVGRAEKEVQLALATPKRPKTPSEVAAFLAEMERKRAVALKQREKQTAYKLKRALADQAERKPEAEPGSHGPAGSNTGQGDDGRGNSATAEALPVALDEQRRLVELVKRWRDGEEDSEHGAREQDVEESQ